MPFFEDDSPLEVIQYSGTMRLIAFGQIAVLAGRHDLVVEADETMTNEAFSFCSVRMAEWYGRYSGHGRAIEAGEKHAI